MVLLSGCCCSPSCSSAGSMRIISLRLRLNWRFGSQRSGFLSTDLSIVLLEPSLTVFTLVIFLWTHPNHDGSSSDLLTVHHHDTRRYLWSVGYPICLDYREDHRGHHICPTDETHAHPDQFGGLITLVRPRSSFRVLPLMIL